MFDTILERLFITIIPYVRLFFHAGGYIPPNAKPWYDRTGFMDTPAPGHIVLTKLFRITYTPF